ncbi:MAG: GDSL-type esterase/lipase family protein [Patescibacteria group bacterium]
MRITLFVLGGLALLLVAYWGIKFFMTVQVSKRIINSTVAYEKAGEGENSVLVLGDSTAVGIGADRPEESVAGRVSTFLQADRVENYAVSGAVTSDLNTQRKNATLSSYGLILIQIGGNDIIRFKPAEDAGEELRAAIQNLPDAQKVVIISAGDVGGATLFPWPVRPFHTRLNNEYHETFARIAKEEGVTYVNFGNSPATKIINEKPEIYLAADGLHPSSEGYRLWFEEIQSSL